MKHLLGVSGALALSQTLYGSVKEPGLVHINISWFTRCIDDESVLWRHISVILNITLPKAFKGTGFFNEVNIYTFAELSLWIHDNVTQCKIKRRHSFFKRKKERFIINCRLSYKNVHLQCLQCPITYNNLNYGGANWYAKTVVNIQVYLVTFID